MDIREAAAAEERPAGVREVDASGLSMDRAQGLVLDELRALTERARPFAAVLLMPAPPEGRASPPTGAAGATAIDRVRALKAIRPALAAHCRGLAFVAPSDIPAERAKAIHSDSRLWGCPTTATQDAKAARTWAEQRVRP